MIIIVMGVSGAGKSTVGRILAERLDWTFIDCDAFHPEQNIDKMRRGLSLSEEDRAPWLSALRGVIERWLGEGSDGVLACPGLTAAHRQALIPKGAPVFLVFLKGSYELMERRLLDRSGHFMPASLLSHQFALLEEPTDALVVDAALPPDAIVEKICSQLPIPLDPHRQRTRQR